MRLYDTLSGKKVLLVKPRGRSLKLFVCGPTVYDYAHIGHARTYLVFDILVRWLRHRGFKIFYLQNITDIDDKIIERGADARFFERSYHEDMKRLGASSVDRYARASQYLLEIKKQIKRMIEAGFAYEIKNGVYFEVKKFPDYGRLSRQNLEELRPGYRIEPDPEKKDPLDFALWKNKDGGRPGWHIEDTAITEKFFGPQYDIHGGGADLKFPHHEAEIAQQESLSGKKPLVKIWLHTGPLLVSDEKMSKSLGNFITIRDFLKNHSADGFRFLVLSHHYRSPINYTDRLIEQAENALTNITKFLRTLTLKPAKRMLIKKAEASFQKAMADDFNTPKALAVLFNFVSRSGKAQAERKWIFDKFNLLGIKLEWPKIGKEVLKLLKEREKLRKQKLFTAADVLRKKIQRLGFEIED